MLSLASDLRLADRDVQLLREVARGQKRALGRAIERFHPVLVALLFHRLKNFATALQLADGVTRGTFRPLLRGELSPEDVPNAALRQVETVCVPGGGAAPEETGEGLHGLHMAKKLMRRRAATSAVQQLPLTSLLAMVLRYHAHWTTEQMVGIVADDEDSVRSTLLNGHLAVVEAMKGESE